MGSVQCSDVDPVIVGEQSNGDTEEYPAVAKPTSGHTSFNINKLRSLS